MKRFALLFTITAFTVAVPATAQKPPHPSHPTHPSPGSKGHHCTPRNEGYNGSGALVSATLTPAAKKGHYDGTITVDLARANHKAPTGTQTFTLTNARVRFGKGINPTAPAAGSRVQLHGKITVLAGGCSAQGFTATTTIRHVVIKRAK
jgi:hypothetical protein